MVSKSKNKNSLILIIIVAFAVISIALYFGFSSSRSITQIAYVGNNGLDNWSGSYMLLNGTTEKSLELSGDGLHIAVETKEGTISIEVEDSERNVIFSESNIGTASFDVEISGKVFVRITADHHKGSFSVSSDD